MPFVRISIAGPGPGVEQIRQLQSETTVLMANLLGKRAAVTVVAVETTPAAHWAVGGDEQAEGTGLAQMTAFITAGTNTDVEKAAFIAAAYAMLRRVLGGASSPTYVVIHDISATDWGFDGQTQAARRLAAQAL